MKSPVDFDGGLDRELVARLATGDLPRGYRAALGPALAGQAASWGAMGAFSARALSVVDGFKRPSLLIQQGAFEPPDSQAWIDLLNPHAADLARAIQAVGRIEVTNHARLSWVGTGVLVDDNVVATNRHVAEEFVARDGQGFRWRTAAPGVEVEPTIDFLEEYQGDSADQTRLSDVRYLANTDGPDLALLTIDGGAVQASPLELGGETAAQEVVAVIGYSWRESRVAPEVEEVYTRIFGDIYNVKRLAPGMVTVAAGDEVSHDCSTLGGSSGSAVVDLETGQLVALHKEGGISSNRAVPASVISELL